MIRIFLLLISAEPVSLFINTANFDYRHSERSICEVKNLINKFAFYFRVLVITKIEVKQKKYTIMITFGVTSTIAAMSAMDINETENTSKNNNYQDDRWADLEKSDNNKGGFGCFLVSLLFLGLLGWGVYSMGLVSDPYERTEMCTTTVEHVEKKQVTTTVYQTDNIRSGETDWTVTQ